MPEVTSPVKYFICGGVGGVCAVLVGHPMDTIKVRLQTMPLPKRGERPLYTGAWDCFKKTIKYEGIRGLYKGMSAPLASIVPIFAISFFGFGFGKRLIQSQPEEVLTKLQLFAAGAFSGVFTTIVMAPGERVKCLLQIQSAVHGPPKYAGPIDVIKQLYIAGGIRNLYKGSVATIVRDAPGSGVYFLTYEWIKELAIYEKASKLYIFLMTVFAGGCAGIAMWVVVLPADVLKSRLQTASEGKYSGIKDAFMQLMAKEGPAALYKGAGPVMLRAFPANAACFVGFEIMKVVMRSRKTLITV